MEPETITPVGSQKEKDAYAAMLHDATGNNYSYDASGALKNDGADAKFSGKKSTTLAGLINKGIGSAENYKLNLTGENGDDNNTFIDSYKTSSVDMADLRLIGKCSKALQGALIGHFLNEIQEVKGYSTASEADHSTNFNTAHTPSLGVEGTIFGELIGDASITTRTDLSKGFANGYETSNFIYNASNKFELIQGIKQNGTEM